MNQKNYNTRGRYHNIIPYEEVQLPKSSLISVDQAIYAPKLKQHWIYSFILHLRKTPDKIKTMQFLIIRSYTFLQIILLKMVILKKTPLENTSWIKYFYENYILNQSSDLWITL